jgi:flagellar protein FliS
MQMNRGFYANCLEDEIFSATPVELIRMLYRSGLDSVLNARDCLGRGDIAGRCAAINKCLAILTELTVSLDRTQGGELTQSLTELYDYMGRRLIEANIQQSDGPLEETAKLLATLLDGWAKCEPERESAAAAIQPPPGYEVPAMYEPVAYTY